MDVSSIIERNRRQCNVDENQYTDTQWVEDINFVYQDLCNSIVTEVAEDFFWDYVKTDTAIWQSEYNISELIVSTWPTVTADIKKIQSVGIKYDSTDEYYTKLKKRDFNLFEKHRDYYADNWNESEAIYTIKDESIFIFPTPDAVVTEWLDIEVIYTPVDLVLASTSDDIKLPREFHILLWIWMEQYGYRALQKINEANESMNRYNIEKQKMISHLRGRYQWVSQETMPDLSHLE